LTTVFYLVRHAEAEAHGGTGDGAPRLTEAGRTGFERLVSAIGPELRVSRVLTSPLARARETAAILARASGAAAVTDEALSSGRCTGSDLLQLGRSAGSGVALVGHNPELAEALVLAAGSSRRVPPGTVAAVAADDVGYRLLWMHSP